MGIVRLTAAVFALVTFGTTPTAAVTVYSIGNSLTFDATRNYAGNLEHTIDCNRTLQRIFDNPATSCIESHPRHRDWSVALTTKKYDYVTVQPWHNTTLDENVATISEWMRLQPDAKFIVHTGWASRSIGSDRYSNALPNGGSFEHSEAFFGSLIERLEALYPGRQVGSTNIIGTLNSIAVDIENSDSEIDSLSSLYRDSVHFGLAGQYIATNSLYRATGQPFSPVNFESLPLATRQYLNARIVDNVVAVPEPVCLVSFTFLAVFYAYRRNS